MLFKSVFLPGKFYLKISPKICYNVKAVLHPNWPFGLTLYHQFYVLSFHAILYFLSKYHMVKEEKLKQK